MLFSYGVCDQCEKLTEQNAALMRQLLTMESEAIDAEQATATAKSGSADAAVKVCSIHTHHYICILTIDGTSGKGFYNTFAGRESESLGSEDEGPRGGELVSIPYSKHLNDV